MSEEKYIYGDLFPDEKRLKNFGKFLKYSLDELPSLINIIKGNEFYWAKTIIIRISKTL